jgi:hypothetical protein
VTGDNSDEKIGEEEVGAVVKVEDENTQTTSPEPTNTCTDSEDDFKEIKCWTVNLTTYKDPELKRYGGNLNCIAFTDTDWSEGESCNTPSFHTLHTYLRDAPLFFASPLPSAHNDTWPPPAINKLMLRNWRITVCDRRDTTGIFDDGDTTKVFDRWPQDDKKLHSSTSNVWTDPTMRSPWGMMIGDEISEERDLDEDVRLERYWWSRVDVEEVEEEEEDDELDCEEVRMDTRKVKDCHSRPPDPVDEPKSNNRSSHTPNSLGRDRVTTGGDKNSAEGADRVRLWESLKDQPEQLTSICEVHRAFNTPPFNSTTSPTSTAKRETGDISKELSSIQTQPRPLIEREDEAEAEDERAWEIENNFEQSFIISDFMEPPSFVEPVNLIKILLPSEENAADFINGPDTGTSNPFTTNSEPEENQISKEPLDPPNTLTFNE